MTRYKHPLLGAEFKHIPKEQREQLPLCCLRRCKGWLEATRLDFAWLKVEEQPAADEGSSSNSNSRYTAGKLDLGTTLHHTFHDPASRQHGLCACKACARRRAKVCEAATAVAETALQPETDPDAVFPHHLLSSQPSLQPSLQPSSQLGHPS